MIGIIGLQDKVLILIVIERFSLISDSGENKGKS